MSEKFRTFAPRKQLNKKIYVMSENIKTTFKDGKVEYYMTQSSHDLRLPSLGFTTEEEAELAVAVAKTLKAYGKEGFNLGREMVYVLRVLGIQNEWTE